MNRAERRRQGIVKKNPTYTLNKEQIDNIKKEATEKAIDNAFLLLLGLPCMVMEEYFGKLMKKEGRLQTFVNLVLDQYECFEQGYVTLEDIQEYLRDTCDVKIEKEG